MTECSSSGRLYKQLYGILSCIYISSLVTVKMCLILYQYQTHPDIIVWLHWSQNDMTQQSGQTLNGEVKINHFIVLVSGHTETNPTGVVSPDNSWLWPNRISLFQADSLVRHMQQLVYDLSVEAMDKTYPIELVRDILCPGTKAAKSTTKEASSQNFGMK